MARPRYKTLPAGVDKRGCGLRCGQCLHQMVRFQRTGVIQRPTRREGSRLSHPKPAGILYPGDYEYDWGSAFLRRSSRRLHSRRR